jgi:predicted TIM-barrel fold metal-dependent hydrolase
MHVVDPRKFPLAKDAQYQPSPHTIDQAKKFLSSLGIEKMVIVQPSIYGNDNSCTLDGLQQLGTKNGRAVIQFDADTTSEQQLREWHALGVRGVRLNFKSVGAKLEGTSLAIQLHKYANAVKSLNWVMELYISMEDIPLLEPIIPHLGNVKICIDHFGHPSDASIATAQSSAVLPGFTSLANLLKLNNVWVKVSASYRLHRDPQHPLVQSLARYILRSRPDRCVFATDWPHTRFEDVDVTEYLEELFNWCEAENVSIRQVLVDNADELFDAEK